MKKVNIYASTLVKKLQKAQSLKKIELEEAKSEIENDSRIKELLETDSFEVRYEYFEEKGIVRIAFCNPKMMNFPLSDEVFDESLFVVPNKHLKEIHYTDFIVGVGFKDVPYFVHEGVSCERIGMLIATEKPELLKRLVNAILKYNCLDKRLSHVVYYGEDNASKLSIGINGNVKFESTPVEEAMRVLKRVRIPKKDLSKSFAEAVRLGSSRRKI